MTTKLRKKKHLAHPCPDHAVDIVLEYGQLDAPKIVLVDRKYPPYGLALPGGMVEQGNDLANNAEREVQEETNLVAKMYAPNNPLCALSDPQRDPRGHIITSAFVGYGTGTPRHGSDAKGIFLFSREEIITAIEGNRFAFPDHGEILKNYFERWNRFDRCRLLESEEKAFAYLTQAWRGFP